jgi:hypothetical protein
MTTSEEGGAGRSPGEVLLVLASGHQRFREYLLASAHAAGVPMWIFDPEAPTWQDRYAVGVEVLDVFDPATAVRAATALSRRRTVTGCLLLPRGRHRLAAAHVAEALGLPGPGTGAVAAVRDKHLTRQRLRAAGLRQPRFAVVRPDEDATAGPRGRLPAGGQAPRPGRQPGRREGGPGPATSRRPWTAARTTVQAGMENDGSVLLEEYLSGPEISLDAAVFDGEYLPYVLARKRVGAEPYFEEIGHTVDARDPLLDDRELHADGRGRRTGRWAGGTGAPTPRSS